jgi:hypothetical protein
LEADPVEGDQILDDEVVAESEVLVERQLKQGGDAVLAVVADAIAICGQNEEEVEGALTVVE